MITKTTYPSQSVPRTEKLQSSKGKVRTGIPTEPDNEKTWGETNLDYFIEQGISQDPMRSELYSLYRAYDGALVHDDYRHITNPLNTDNPDYKRFPATLRNYNIIKPVIQEFIGERSEKPLIPIAVLGNKDADNNFKQKLTQAVNAHLQQEAINDLAEQGILPEDLAKQQVDINEFVKQFTDSWDKDRIRDAQNIIEYLTYDLNLDEGLQEAYKHWLICGRVITYKNVLDEDLEHDIVPATDYYFPLYTNIRDIEDLPWGVRKFSSLSINGLLDILRNRLSLDDIEWLESRLRIGRNSPTSVLMTTQLDLFKQDSTPNTPNEISGTAHDNFTLYHVQWKSLRKVGILTTVDEVGNPIQVDVDETYTLNKQIGDISIEWKFITEVWEGYRLDGEDNQEYKYFGVQPLPIQRSELNSNQKAKLSYNGKYDVDIDGRIVSAVKTGYSYQVLYNVFHFQFEKIMNKNKEKILMIPIGLMPNKKGWDEDKFLYFMDAMGYGFFDETKPNAIAALQGLKQIDLGLSQYASKMSEFLFGIRQEWWDAVGMNRQRYGNTQASDGKATNEQALFHASLITAELNRKFDKFVEKEYQGLLDWSKVAWINGKKANYVRNDGSRAILNIVPEDHLGTDCNIFIKNSSEEYRKVKTMENIALTLAQNNTRGSDIAALLKANSLEKIEQILKEGEKLQDEYTKSLEDQKNATAIKIEEIATERENTKQETDMYKADKLYDGVIDKELAITERELLLAELEPQEEGKEPKDNQMFEQAKISILNRKQQHDEKKHNDLMKRKDEEIAIKRIAAKKKPSTK